MIKPVSYETPTKYQQALRHSMPIQQKRSQFSDIDMASPFKVAEDPDMPQELMYSPIPEKKPIQARAFSTPEE